MNFSELPYLGIQGFCGLSDLDHLLVVVDLKSLVNVDERDAVPSCTFKVS